VTEEWARGATLLGLLSEDVAAAVRLHSNTGSSAVGIRGKTFSRRTRAQQMSPLELMLRTSPTQRSDSEPVIWSTG
jgi:hypothetical protein